MIVLLPTLNIQLSARMLPLQSGRPPHSTKFYRWKQKEEQNYLKSPDQDEQLPQDACPIRHENQVHGLFHTIKEDREFAKSTNPKEEPFMKDSRTGRQHNFDPLWYPELISMAGESLDSMGFDPETRTGT